ncbi:HAMP domain-containing histidine kinase [Streptosporangiaceae bacterium NEAU-GS5]|nr:HAMP domain-containing histidine kinase [Streptosporangiaceae bacterium NEAU-GS5]
MAAAVAVAIAVGAVASWLSVRGLLERQIRESVEQYDLPDMVIGDMLRYCQAKQTGGSELMPPRHVYDPAGRELQLILADGTVCGTDSALITPTAAERALVRPAGSPGKPVERNAVTADGTAVYASTRTYQPGPPNRHDYDHVVITEPMAVMTFRSTEDMDAALRSLGIILGVVAALGVLGAALSGLWLARTALRPVGRLTGAVEHVAKTEDLDVRIPVTGSDEIARLSQSFNTMTAALSNSRDRQRQLVSDAGHELRTPLTSLRTNIELLLRSENSGRPLEPETKRRLLVSVKEQFEEMSSLIGDLLELTRSAETGALSADVDFQEVVGSAVERARRRGPGLHLDVDLSPWTVHGDARGLTRAVVNLLDNAVKFSPSEGEITVRLKEGELTIRDRGPGIAEDELPHVFERFWRSPSARSLPGSGLGLAIVAQAVRDAGGEVTLAPAPGGGTLARVILPGRA